MSIWSAHLTTRHAQRCCREGKHLEVWFFRSTEITTKNISFNTNICTLIIYLIYKYQKASIVVLCSRLKSVLFRLNLEICASTWGLVHKSCCCCSFLFSRGRQLPSLSLVYYRILSFFKLILMSHLILQFFGF